MGFRGLGNSDERDKLFEKSFQEKPIDQRQVRKGLEGLFNAKPKEELCAKGHAWVMDRSGIRKCARCNLAKPA